MTPEEVAAKDAKIPEATDAEIASVYCTFALWDFERSYYEIAKVALVAAKARGLAPADLRRIMDTER